MLNSGIIFSIGRIIKCYSIYITVTSQTRINTAHISIFETVGCIIKTYYIISSTPVRVTKRTFSDKVIPPLICLGTQLILPI